MHTLPGNCCPMVDKNSRTPIFDIISTGRRSSDRTPRIGPRQMRVIEQVSSVSLNAAQLSVWQV